MYKVGRGGMPHVSLLALLMTNSWLLFFHLNPHRFHLPERDYFQKISRYHIWKYLPIYLKDKNSSKSYHKLLKTSIPKGQREIIDSHFTALLDLCAFIYLCV
jgi:hypothetical protein